MQSSWLTAAAVMATGQAAEHPLHFLWQEGCRQYFWTLNWMVNQKQQGHLKIEIDPHLQ